MPLIGLALASALAFAPPEGEPAVIVVTPAPAPAPTVSQWGPSGDVAVSGPALPPPPPPPPPTPYRAPRKPMAGIGLMVSGAAVFGFGLASRLSQFDSARSNCSRWKSGGHVSVTSCFDYFDSPGVDGNDLIVGMAYGSSMVLTMIGAGALGQHQAWQSVHGTQIQRNPTSRYAFGAIFTGLGVASIAAHYALIYTDAQNPCTTYECNVKRRSLWIAASDGGAALLGTGFGLLSWGGNYAKNRRYYERTRWSVLPTMSPGSMGGTLTMQF